MIKFCGWLRPQYFDSVKVFQIIKILPIYNVRHKALNIPCVCPSKVRTLQYPFSQFLINLNLSKNICFHCMGKVHGGIHMQFKLLYIHMYCEHLLGKGRSLSSPSSSLGYPDPQKIRRSVWAKGFGGNVHSGMLLTYNCLLVSAGLADFASTYSGCIFMSEKRLTL